VLNAINNLKDETFADFDKISVKILKQIVYVYCMYYIHICT